MIDSNGYLRCDGILSNGQKCNTILGRNLEGRVEIICYRSRCHRNNVFNTRKEYKSHKLVVYQFEKEGENG